MSNEAKGGGKLCKEEEYFRLEEGKECLRGEKTDYDRRGVRTIGRADNPSLQFVLSWGEDTKKKIK